MQLRKPQNLPFLGLSVHSYPKGRASQDNRRDPGPSQDPEAIGWASAPLKETPCPPTSPSSQALSL